MKGKMGNKMSVYNAQGSMGEKEAMDKEDGFKRGGKVKKHKAAGHAKGEAAKKRLDRPGRAAGGRSPMSTASKVSGGAADDDAKKEVMGDGGHTDFSVYRRGGKVKKHK